MIKKYIDSVSKISKRFSENIIGSTKILNKNKIVMEIKIRKLNTIIDIFLYIK